tara:strand:- start:363 stop:593 length:231 start_codon:yes stop_codon:yes gene_type:complete
MHPGATYSGFRPCIGYDENLIILFVVPDQVAMNSELFSKIQSQCHVLHEEFAASLKQFEENKGHKLTVFVCLALTV